MKRLRKLAAGSGARRGPAVVLMAARVAYGVALVAAPGRLTESWLGAAAASGAGTVPLRGLGAREAALHTGVLIALLRGENVERWLVVSMLGDLADVISTVAARHELPPGAALKTTAAGGGAAALTLAMLGG